MSRRKEFFPEVTDQQWNDWHWQVKNRIETVDELKKYIKLTAEEEEGIRESLKTLRMAITPYYLTLIDPENPHCPIRKQAIPTVEELKRSPADLEDPLHEDSDSPVPGLTHRYPDRVLFLITDMCSMYCRHCTRRRFAGQHDCATPEKQIDDCIDYIARTPQVRDVLLSGGDALLVSDEKLEYIISRLRAIPHVEIIRIGSRTPVVLPQRITPELVNMLKKYHPIWLNTHFNHPNEVTPESKQACARLADAGIPLGNQSVLLRGVNDCTHIMKKLVHELVKMRGVPTIFISATCRWASDTSALRYRKASKSSRTSGDTPRVTPFRHSSWTLRAVVARFLSCRTMSSRRLRTAWYSATTKV